MIRIIAESPTWKMVAAVVSGSIFCGCSGVSYYHQALVGQAQILSKQQPIRELLRFESVDSKRAKKLQLILELRKFAESDLGLQTGRSYQNFADLEREHVLWSIFAAPEFSLEPKTWFYPVVGSLDYRGYFKEEDARRCASRLRSEGFDVFVAEVDAYSTLGWLSDPVLNTFVDYEDVDLAELIFHELTHRRIYRSGETAFNEALATLVAQEGVARWLRKSARLESLQSYRSRLERSAAIYAEIANTRQLLEALYAQAMPANEMRSSKRSLLWDLQERLKLLFSNWGGRAPESWIEDLPNNARLNATATYYEHVATFDRHLHQECAGNLPQFLTQMEVVNVSKFLQSGRKGN